MFSGANYVLRDCGIFVEGENKLGSMEELTLPVPSIKTEEIRNAGMAYPIEMNMGFEKPEFSFTLTAVDPDIIGQLGLSSLVMKKFMVTGALQHETGEIIQARAFIHGFIKKYDPGSWKPGDIAKNKFEVSVRAYELLIDGKTILKMSPRQVIIDGVDQTSEINAALMV